MELTKITVVAEVTPEFLTSIMEIAWEGGIDYWETQAPRFKLGPDGKPYLIVFGEEGVPCKVTHETLAKALQTVCAGRLVRSDIANSVRLAVNENDAGHIDAEAADVLVQIAAFNDIVYG